MIRLHLKPAILKSLSFNKNNKTLDIEFKDGLNMADFLDIPIAILENYVKSMKQVSPLNTDENYPANLKIVHSNFKVS